jgi:hypothetical protein
MARFQDQLLYTPIQYLAYVKLVFRRTGDLVYPPKLIELLTGFSEHAQDFSFEAELINSAGKTIGAVKDLTRRRRNTYSPGRAL